MKAAADLSDGHGTWKQTGTTGGGRESTANKKLFKGPGDGEGQRQRRNACYVLGITAL